MCIGSGSSAGNTRKPVSAGSMSCIIDSAEVARGRLLRAAVLRFPRNFLRPLPKGKSHGFQVDGNTRGFENVKGWPSRILAAASALAKSVELDGSIKSLEIQHVRLNAILILRISRHERSSFKILIWLKCKLNEPPLMIRYVRSGNAQRDVNHERRASRLPRLPTIVISLPLIKLLLKG